MTLNPDNFVTPDDPILIKIAEVIDPKDIQLKKTQNIIDQMLSIAYGEQKDHSKPVLVGLAAPQVGISKRIILVDVAARGHAEVADLRVFINPEIMEMSEDKEEWYEGCFSTDCVCGVVNRPKIIKVKYYDRKGNSHEDEYDGYVARIFQHEIDHLNGKEFVQHINDDDKLHWVEPDQFPEYRDKEAWRNWPIKCPRSKWYKIKGIR